MLNLKMMFILLFCSSLAFANDEGKELFDTGSCLECHNHEDFGDEKSKIKMFKQLESRVQACQLAGDDQLFDDEVHSLSEFMDKEYYKLKE